MRKLHPNDVVDDFVQQVSNVKGYYNRVAQLIIGSDHERLDISTLAEQSFVGLATAFEGFLSDLFYAYINRDPSAFLTDFEIRISTSVGSKFGAWHAGHLTYKKERHIKVSELQNILDPNGWNLTFKDSGSLIDRANAWLIPAHRDLIVALSAHDQSLIDTAKAIRDFIAHRSAGSKRIMNAVLSEVDQGPPNDNLGRGVNEVHNIGSFLKSEIGGTTRIMLYCDRTIAIANSLRI